MTCLRALALLGLSWTAFAQLPCETSIAFLGPAAPESRIYASAIDFARIAECGVKSAFSTAVAVPARLDPWFEGIQWARFDVIVYRLPFEEALAQTAGATAILERDAQLLARIRAVSPQVRIVFTGLIGYPVKDLEADNPMYAVLAPYRRWVDENRRPADAVVDILQAAALVGGPTRLVARPGQIATAELLLRHFGYRNAPARETFVNARDAYAAPTNTKVTHLTVKEWISWSQVDGLPARPYVWSDPETESVLRALAWHRSAAVSLRVVGLPNERYRLRIDGRPVAIVTRAELEAGVDTGQWLHNANARAARLFEWIHQRTVCHVTGAGSCDDADGALESTLTSFAPGSHDYELEPVNPNPAVAGLF